MSFLGDTGNRVVLGAFTATFLYCSLVLRTLIQFIHHAAVGIRVERIIAAMNRDLIRFIAIAGVHHLRAALARLATRRAPARCRYDERGRSRTP